MTDQTNTGGGEARPTTYHEASGYDWDIVKAQARYEELTDRDLYARSRADLEARGEYDPAKHGTATPEPLTLSERLELLANGEVLARYYRHPAMLDHAAKAGASWEQIGEARGTSTEQARRDYREWAEGQHDLWTGKLGGEPGRFGLDGTEYAAAVARAGLERRSSNGAGFRRGADLRSSRVLLPVRSGW
jgi:hypothetical protein